MEYVAALEQLTQQGHQKEMKKALDNTSSPSSANKTSLKTMQELQDKLQDYSREPHQSRRKP